MNKSAMIKYLVQHAGADETELKAMPLDELKAYYKEMVEEFSDDSTMWPNGRDTDAEDEDGV